MRNRLLTAAAALLINAVGQQAMADDFTTSEAACLQRQVDVKKAEDLLNRTIAELGEASLDKAPEAKLGGAIGQTKSELLMALQNTRDVLRKMCDALYP